MSKLTASATLAATQLPLLSRHTKQPVIIGKYDINYNKQVAGNTQDEDKETTIPTLVYGENILPTTYGYKAVGYETVLDEISPTAEIQSIHQVSLGTGETYLYAYVIDATTPANTGHWIVEYDYIGKSAVWTQLANETITFAGTGTLITSAIVNGRAFIFFEGTKCKEITTGAIADVTLTGLTASAIIGIFASSGYLLAWTLDTIHNSSLDDPADFAPSSVTGAGSKQLQEARGRLMYCKDAYSGFIVYTDLNAIYAQYSNDFREPFIYRKIDNSAGIAGPEDIFYGDSSIHYIRTGAIFAKIVKNALSVVLTEFNSALASAVIETFNTSTKELEEAQVASIDTKLTYVNSGLLLASYKADTDTVYQYALYYNAELNRYGKLSYPHAFAALWPFDTIWMYSTVGDYGEALVSDMDMDTYASTAVLGNLKIQNNSVLALFSATGAAVVLIDTLRHSYSGKVLLGPFQLARDYQLQLVRLVVKNAIANQITCTILTSYSGEETEKLTTLEAVQKGKLVVFSAPEILIGYNHTICLEGAFDLSSILLEVVPRGKVRLVT